MKKYNTFKLIYLKNDYTLGEIVDVTVEGDYLVGTVPHLSTYDNILKYVSILIISALGLIGLGLYTKKKNN